MWGQKEKTDPLLLEGFGMGNGLHRHPKQIYRQLYPGINGKSRPVVLWKGDTARKKRFVTNATLNAVDYRPEEGDVGDFKEKEQVIKKGTAGGLGPPMLISVNC